VSTQLPPGYTNLGVLGSGTAGVVYHARQDSLNRPVALKHIEKQTNGSPVLDDEALSEGRALASLGHPNIVRIYESIIDDSGYWLAMQYIAGQDLQEVIDTRLKLDTPESITWTLQVADALSAAHQLGVVHRDVKPANVIVNVDESGTTAHLADFGVVAIQRSLGDRPTGITVGTPAYMAPEQVTGGAVGPRSDLYALALIAYTLLTGEHPFIKAATTPHEMMLAQTTTEPPEPTNLGTPFFPDEAWECISMALSKDPAQRQTSVSEFRNQLTVAVPITAPTAPGVAIFTALTYNDPLPSGGVTGKMILGWCLVGLVVGTAIALLVTRS
jgi:serine/threonine protein kinase